MSGLEKAIAAAVHRYCDYEAGDEFAADAVLAMPEMQAIRALLLNLVENCAVGYWDFGGQQAARNYLRNRGAPPSVVAWVLDA